MTVLATAKFSDERGSDPADAGSCPRGELAGRGGRKRRRIAFFGHDASESTIIKRVHAFQDNGSEVVGFMFRRIRPGVQRVAPCKRIELGVTQDRQYIRRLVNLVAGLVRILRHGDLVARSDVIYARNIDMLLLAVLAKLFSSARSPLVYEVLDIRQVFIGGSPVNRLFRWAERRLMSKSDLLVVSSPEYISRYFHPVQGYVGAWQLLENKMSSGRLPDRDGLGSGPAAGPPWVIGMFGVLKCARSLQLLVELAQANPDRVVIHLRGTASECDIPASRLAEVSARLPNVHYFGPYDSPDDLADIYGQVHFVWSADFLDPQNNSLLCLPNRLYEGCYFGAVALANKGTATARKIERDHLGATLDEPLGAALDGFFKTLTTDRYITMREALLRAPDQTFVDTRDTARLLDVLDDLGSRDQIGACAAGVAGG